MVFSAERALHDAQADPHYLGNDNVASRSVWVPAPDGQSEIYVPAATTDAPPDDVVPTVFKAFVQLLGEKFYLTPDGHYNPQRLMPWQVGRSATENLLSGRGSVLLGPVPNTYPVLHNEWAKYQSNIDVILQAVLPCVNKSGFCTKDGSKMILKLIHNFFDARPLAPQEPLDPTDDADSDPEEPDDNGTDAEENSENGLDHAHARLEELELDRDPPFRTVNVPVHPLNQALLLEVAETHIFNPLCVFIHGHRERPLHPSQYARVLPGAIAQVTFTLSHRLMRRPQNVSHFSAIIDEIEVFQRPARISLSPSKIKNQPMFRKRETGDAQGGSASGVKRARVA